MISTYGDNSRIQPDQIKHGLDDKQAYLWIGHQRLAVPTSASNDELDSARFAAQILASEAAMFLNEIQGLLDKRAAERADAENEAHEQHAEPVDALVAGEPALSAVEFRRAMFDDMTREAVEEGTYDQPAPDVLVAGDALADEPEFEWIELTVEEYEAALANELAKLGCTYEELVAMARTGDYPTPDHRLLWLRIKPLSGEQPDILTNACDRWHLDVPHEPHFHGVEGLRCPGWSAPAGEDR